MPQAVLTEQRAGTDSVVQWQLQHVACLPSWLASQVNLDIINVDRIDHQIQQIKYAYNKYPKGSWTTFLIFKSQECFGMCKVPHRNIRCRIIFFFFRQLVRVKVLQVLCSSPHPTYAVFRIVQPVWFTVSICVPVTAERSALIQTSCSKTECLSPNGSAFRESTQCHRGTGGCPHHHIWKEGV